LTVLGDLKSYSWPCWVIYDAEGYKLKGDDFDQITLKLQPGDVLLRRFDAYLDNGFIPGFWNHAGICTGAKGDVNPEITHAVAEGVIKETLFDFCHADHIVILRPNFTYDKKIVKNRLDSAIGRPYDFDFDFTNGDRLSCTELIAYAFNTYDHGIVQTPSWLGRIIVKPDSLLSANFTKILEIKKPPFDT
jgi:uncharacterized protein YycO